LPKRALKGKKKSTLEFPRILSKKTWKAPSAWPISVLFYSQKENEREKDRRRKKTNLI
jgi:hypothetical protein